MENHFPFFSSVEHKRKYFEKCLSVVLFIQYISPKYCVVFSVLQNIFFYCSGTLI